MSKVPAPRADAAARAERAYLARLNGGTWRQCADVAGYADEQGARRAVERLFHELPAPDRDAQRHIPREQAQSVLRQALQDVRDRRPGAVTAAVRVLDLTMRLDGLGAPAQISLVDPTAHEIEEYVERLMGPRRYVDADILDD